MQMPPAIPHSFTHMFRMSYRLKFLSGILVAVAFTSCAGPNSWVGYKDTRPQGPAPQPGYALKYERYGHQTTTYMVARIAGFEYPRATRLSHFSQAPDDLAFRYSATAVAIWGSVPPFWGYRHRIVSVLHSLHGGDADGVTNRRKTLHNLVSASVRAGESNDWQTGFLVHAFGDSYAHVKPGPVKDTEVAYREGVGHGFDFGKVKPDVISAHSGTYKTYVNSLYSSLATEKGSKVELDRFLKTVEAAVAAPEDVREQKVEEAITHFQPFDEPISERPPAKLSAKWNKEIKGVDAFLRQVDKEL